MNTLAAAVIFSFFLNAGVLVMGGDLGNAPQQQTAPQTKTIVINNDNWVTPVMGAIATLGAAGLGVWAVRSRRKEN